VRTVLGIAMPATLLIALIVVPHGDAGSSGGSPTSTTSTSTSTSTSTTSTTSVTTTTVPTHNPDNPFTSPVLAAYLRHRANVVTAAVYDVNSGETFTYHNGIRERTASMVKVDILADLLYESEQDGRPLTAKQQSLAYSMIEASDNNAATALWTQIGGRDSIDAFNALIGFKDTVPSWSWGDIETTPLDQLQLLKVIALPNRILDNASRLYEMTLLENVISSERFGLGWGSPVGATVGVKDGYYPEITTGWQLNTTGFVKFHGRFYLATIMCAENPDEDYGISTLTTVASDIWKYLKP
jgi:Beta-lactamase enzyme family